MSYHNNGLKGIAYQYQPSAAAIPASQVAAVPMQMQRNGNGRPVAMIRPGPGPGPNGLGAVELPGVPTWLTSILITVAGLWVYDRYVR